ncbi:PAS domain-containing protein [Rhizobium sp. BE258]|uniref:PAS domain-containing protein n=1 Tax=Rhizobium sp. BE258 TaxID=2817722 RepID=UPI000DD8CB29|nr:PAS domain-containing protein [Rhizobium sp. BE258]MDR7142734.1 PAS domain S-box-containing protein [Rhizobium sp. BE258]
MHQASIHGHSFLKRGSEAAEIIANFDWSATSLGPISGWSPTLRSVCSLILNSPVPIVTLWNEDGVMIYNDAYSDFAGRRHPNLFGSKVREGWPEVADFNDHVMKVVLAGGTLVYEDQELMLYRRGTSEPERLWTKLDYSPICDETGKPVAVMAIVVETTAKVKAERQLRAEKARLQKMFEQAPGFVATMSGADHRFEIANAAYQQLVGHRNVIGKTIREALPEVEEQGFVALLDQVRRTGIPYIGSEQLVKLQQRPDAELIDRYLDFIYQPLTGDDGEIGGIFVQGYDVTERKEAEDAARESESRFRLVAENAPVMLWMSDEAMHCLYLNASMRQFWGVAERDISTFDWNATIHPDDVPPLMDQVTKAVARREAFAVEARYRNDEGEYRLLHTDARPRFGVRGEFLGMIGVNSDITDARHEEARRIALIDLADCIRQTTEPTEIAYAAAEILGRAMHVTRAGYGIIDPVAETVTIERDWNVAGNRSIAGTLHFREYGTYIDDLKRNETVVFADVDEDPRTAATSHALKAIGVHSAVTVPLSENGQIAAVLFLNNAVPREWPQVELDFIRDFAERTRTAVERRRAEEALQEFAASLERKVAERSAELDRVWRNAGDILVVMRPDGEVRAINPAWSGLLGHRRKEVAGHRMCEFLVTGDATVFDTALKQAVSGGELQGVELRFNHKQGGQRTVSWRFSFEQEMVYAYGRDVTAEKEQAAALQEAEELIRQTQKMEAIGQLTGGVAHDFNNLLQVVAGNLYLLSKDVVGNERAQRRIDHALAGVNRGSKLASQLLAFGRRQPLEPKVVNVGRFVANMGEMLRRTIGEAIEIETIRAGGLWNTFVDPVQIENAILNLAINARDAMDGSGKLTIEVGNAFIDDDYARRHADVSAGQYVMLAVSDTGSGMPPEVIGKVFEPFFSTKPVGKGTGLGLSMVYGFVKQSGGHVKIYSEIGQGTTVRLYLPRTLEEEDLLTEGDHGPATGGQETILVAEDDEEVRATVVEMLADLGYSILKAKDAASALTVIESGIPIDLLFTDVVMPGPLKSAELARKAKERLPDVAVLFTSGYTENSIVHGGRLDAGVDLLSKPYSREALARKIRHVLNNQRQRNLARAAQGERRSAAAAAPAASLRILYVEDDDFIRMDTAEMLQQSGHRVSEAGSAEEALAKLSPDSFDLLLTDVGLPGLSGAELAKKARALDPQLPVIFATGNTSVAGFEADQSALVLLKPYSQADLAAAVLRQTRPR